MATTEVLNLPILEPSDRSPEVPWRDMVDRLDARVRPVLDKDLTAPPVSPADGDQYIVAATATGAWAAHETDLARWDTALAAWVFTAAAAGWRAWLDDEAAEYLFDGAAWTATQAAPALDTVSSGVEIRVSTLREISGRNVPAVGSEVGDSTETDGVSEFMQMNPEGRFGGSSPSFRGVDYYDANNNNDGGLLWRYRNATGAILNGLYLLFDRFELRKPLSFFQSTLPIPAAGQNVLGFKADGKLYTKDESAVEREVATVDAWFELTDASTIAIDGDSGRKQFVTLAGDRTITLANIPYDGLLLQLRQDGSGGQNPTWPDVDKWRGGSAPDLSAAVAGSAIFVLIQEVDGVVYGNFTESYS